MPRLFVRRSVTAVGIYASVALGFGATIAATRELHSPRGFGDYATVIFTTGFFQAFFDLTVEEALVKYGFRYTAREDWGRLRRLFASALWFKLAGSALAAAGIAAFAAIGPSRLTVALLLAAGIPLCQSLEGLVTAPLYLRSRYDVASIFLAWSMAFRLTGVVVGAHYGLDEAIAGVLAAQALASVSVGIAGLVAFRRFPHAPARPLDEDRREIASFVAQSSVATGVLSLRTALAPLLLGAVTNTAQVGLFKVAQAPQNGFQALSAPARMVLLTEQTRDWEKGMQAAVLRGVRRYSIVAAGIAVVVSPPLLVYVRDLIRSINGPQYVGATGAARLFILAACVQLVVGWTKSFPVTIGRPGLRVWTHGIETAVVLPLVIVFGALWGATGAAGAVLAGMCVFAAIWAVVFLRIRPHDVQEPDGVAEALADVEAEAGALAR
ncbi:MAG TPA: lipopolysaccharide biosynthesis protein [Gaiellaceae bacterium]|nr:lipopolysaccharide biosynthesis protein [Gaiellaceae bacterium]